MTDTSTGLALLERTFRQARAEDRAVLFPYLTAGLPDPDASVELFVAMSNAGADGFEVGIPYADPLMDGPVIMRAGHQALRSGVTVDVSFTVAERVIVRTGKPVLLMTYVNPVLRVGAGEFFARVRSIGAAGAIIADLPVDESAPFVEAAEAVGVGLVQFAAPTTTDTRLRAIAAANPVFVYAVAEVGVTGERVEASRNVERLAQRIRAVCDAPVVFGVGISTPAHAARAAAVGDGVIVGTAIVRRVLAAEGLEAGQDSLRQAVGELVRAVRRTGG
jgi:tryptophan synthase alpha chain